MEIKEKIEERNKKFYTEEGLNALKERFKSWIKLFNENKFPVKAKIIGFGDFVIKDKSDCLSRIRELSELIGLNFVIETEKIKYDQKEEIKETIKWQME